jgi:xylobiose transport system substrate-binding protein
MIKELVDSGAFGKNFGSVSYGAGGTSTLLNKGKAAMVLMGSWEYAVQQGEAPDFAKSGMGYVAFPGVEGGKGDAANVVGNPTNYISVTTAAPKDTAAEFLKTTYSDSYVQGLIEKGEVPVTTNAKAMLAKAADPAYATFQFDLVSKAPSFTQSWDQALGLTLGTPLLTEIQKLFNGQSSPEQFVSAVSAIKK